MELTSKLNYDICKIISDLNNKVFKITLSCDFFNSATIFSGFSENYIIFTTHCIEFYSYKEDKKNTCHIYKKDDNTGYFIGKAFLQLQMIDVFSKFKNIETTQEEIFNFIDKTKYSHLNNWLEPRDVELIKKIDKLKFPKIIIDKEDFKKLCIDFLLK